MNTQTNTTHSPSDHSGADDTLDGVAIVGMSGRFPGAPDIATFWQNLCNGVESIRTFSDQELLDAGIPAALLQHPAFVKSKPMVDGIELFDATFFNYSPREAERIDPQQRLFLECAWEALEQSGCDPQQYPGWIGVYGGIGLPSYATLNLQAATQTDMNLAIANALDYVATRVSYKLNLKGPSMTVQAACATSLLAVHNACQALLDYHCDMALAGGAAIDLPHINGYMSEQGGMQSPEGHVCTFDSRAHGTVFGEAVGVVALKRLENALADGDTIYAVIRGSAVNNDGADKVGFTAPSIEGQTQVIALAQSQADIDPATIGYVEAHGTGTELGDPIEIAALTKAFRAKTQARQFCAIGAVKPNIGHSNAASGVVGLIKTALVLHLKKIPPSLNYVSANAKIDFANSPFYVNTQLSDWLPRPGVPRRAAVSSFGIGGTNVHAILQEAPPVAMKDAAPSFKLLVLSARSETALDTMAANLAHHLKTHSDVRLMDVAHTLQTGRRRFSHRRTLVCNDLARAVGALETTDVSLVSTVFDDQSRCEVTFMFPGQGSQYIGMGKDLYRDEPLFRHHIDHCAMLLQPLLGIDLRQVMYTLDDATGEALLAETRLTQPALFITEYALAQLWLARGVKPQAMIGHSIGEYTAACLAGVFSLNDALILVAARGRLMQAMAPGAMLAIPLGEAEVASLLQAHPALSFAAMNAPTRCVVAGPEEAIQQLEAALNAVDISASRLHTSHAFHSSMMDPALPLFLEELRKIKLSAPSIPYISNVSGAWITDAEATSPEYWAQQLRQAVRFEQGIRELSTLPEQVLLEVGPGRTLTMLSRQTLGQNAATKLASSLPHPRDKDIDDTRFFLENVGKLWQAGVQLEWPKPETAVPRILHLPTYPFERKRYWVESIDTTPVGMALPDRGKKTSLTDWFYLPSWKRSLAPVAPALSDSRCWLIFCSRQMMLDTELITELARQNQRVVTVTADTAFSRLDGNAFTVAADRPEDYDNLFSALAGDNMLPQVILHLWSVTDGSPRIHSPEGHTRTQALGFGSMLYLAQALGRLDNTSPISIRVVSNGMQQVLEGELQYPEKATVLGPCRTIGQEYSHIDCQNIDIEFSSAAIIENVIPALARRLIAEASLPATTNVIALRGEQRWIQTFEAAPITGSDAMLPHLRHDSVYLITGGLGAIGMVMAEALARAVKAKLVLLGRSAFPLATDWENWLTSHGATDDISQKILKLRAFEALGAEIMVLSADIADESAMQIAIEKVNDRFGRISGVLHSAGIPGDGLMQLKTAEEATRVLTPKMNALHVLETLMSRQPPDFMVLCSSVLSFLGAIGQVDYCAANSFLDAYAQYNTSVRGVPTLSINWDRWLDAGMAVAKGHGDIASEDTLPGRDLSGHLLFKRHTNESDQSESYTVKLDATHWLFNEHRLGGTYALPGTAHLELVRAAYLAGHEDHAGQIELSNVFFLSPLMLPQELSREIKVIFDKPDALATASFRISSRLPGSLHAMPWQDHSCGNVSIVNTAARIQNDLAIISDRCTEQTILMEPVNMPNRQPEGPIFWGPRWGSLKQIKVGVNEALAEVELPVEFNGDLAEFVLHPALVDIATAANVPGVTADDVLYLPQSYGRVTIFAALPGKIYSHARYAPVTTTEAGQNAVSFDITIMDRHGNVLVDIASFTLQRIVHTPTYTTLPAVRSNLADSNGITINDDNGIHLNEGAEIFRRLLTQNAFPQIVVNTTDWISSIENVRRVSKDLLSLNEDESGSRPTHARPTMKTAYIAPTGDIQMQLAKIWQNVLGVDQIGSEDNYFELGGDSLQALNIISRIRTAFQVSLQPHQFFDQPTVAGITEKIVQLQTASAGKDESSAFAPAPSAHGQVNKRAEALRDSVGEAGQEADQLQQTQETHPMLVPLQTSVAGRPVFCIHPVGGQVYFYQRISKTLGKHVPVYGIQAAEVATKSGTGHTDLAGMAHAYADIIRTRQPQGPYRLLGWSTGGLIAMAIAAVLEQEGATVEYCGLLDSRPLDHYDTEEQLFIGSTSIIIASVRKQSLSNDEIQSTMRGSPELATLYAQDKNRILPYLLNSMTDQTFTKETLDSLQLQHEITHRHMTVLNGAAPRLLKAPLHICWAHESVTGGVPFNWEDLSASDRTCTYTVNGDHYSMLQEAPAARIADEIATFLASDAENAATGLLASMPACS